MRAALREATPERLEALATFVAAFVPLVVYVQTSSPDAYWLDSPEFTAAALDLDIPHPPGHPLACLWGKLFALLPCGPLPFRVAVGQAAAAALALAALQRAAARSLAALDVPLAPRLLLSLGTTLTLAASHAFWFQAVRAEVYALQTALVCFAFERCCAYACARSGDPRPLYLAAGALGLGLANHHLVAFLAFPAAFAAAVSVLRRRGLPGLGWAAFGVACGLSTYVYLPIRAGTLPPMDLGHPVDWAALVWVVSARVYAHSFGAEAVQPFGERFADLSVILVDNLTPALLLLALLGAYALLRARRSWPLAYLWLCAALCNLVARAWLGPVRANPDMLGYMMPGMAALSVLAALGAGVLLKLLPQGAAGRALALAASLSGVALSVERALANRAENDLAAFHATDVFDAARRGDLPPDAVVFLTTPQASFVHWGAAACDALRPDVLMVPVPFLNYGPRGQLLVRQHPELGPSVADYLRDWRLSREHLTRLARKRPVFVEADLYVTLGLTAHLRPEGLLHRVYAEPVDARELALAARERAAGSERLYASLASDLGERETRSQLLWLHYVDAVHFALQGRREEALRSVRAALALFPEERLAKQLLQELLTAPGPLDLRPYLMKDPPSR